MRIVFISGMAGGPWGGSEVLWSQTAYKLQEMGHAVMASVHRWPQLPKPLVDLRSSGVHVQERRWIPASRFERARAKLLRRRANVPGFAPQWDEIVAFKPDLVCVSHGGVACGLEWMARCHDAGIKCCAVAHCVSEAAWPDDEAAGRIRSIYGRAVRIWFVSEGNRRLFELQTGGSLPNEAIVRNPFQVPFDSPPAWPDQVPGFKVACVGSLEPKWKGQDLLFRVLANPAWRQRDLELGIFGGGSCGKLLRQMSVTLGVSDKVKFHGHVRDVKAIWKSHHALVQPSRQEGLPLSVVEAMLCDRVCIVTDVAGNAELLEEGRTGFIAEAPTVRHLSEAMERAWAKRLEWKAMGCAAGRAARIILPRDPAAVFADELLALCRS